MVMTDILHRILSDREVLNWTAELDNNCPQAHTTQTVIVPPDIIESIVELRKLTQAISKPHKCDKCGAQACVQVYKVPYLLCQYWVCESCDEKLFTLLDRLPCGVPEDGYRHNSLEHLFAQIIIDAFFSK